MSDQIEVLVYRPGKPGSVEKVEKTLDAQQKLVEGYIEMVPMKNGLYLVCNEDGKLRGLEPNFDIGFDTVVGTCFFCRVKNGDSASLTEKDIKAIRAEFG